MKEIHKEERHYCKRNEFCECIRKVQNIVESNFVNKRRNEELIDIFNLLYEGSWTEMPVDAFIEWMSYEKYEGNFLNIISFMKKYINFQNNDISFNSIINQL